MAGYHGIEPSPFPVGELSKLVNAQHTDNPKLAGPDSIELLPISGYYAFQEHTRSQPQQNPNIFEALCLQHYSPCQLTVL